MFRRVFTKMLIYNWKSQDMNQQSLQSGRDNLSIESRSMGVLEKFTAISAIVLMVLIGFTPPVFSQKQADQQPDNKVRITSDRLDTDTDARFAEFSGNVKASQGNTEIFADRLKIYYKKSSDDPATGLSGGESIQRIVASGNVRINFGDRKAVAEKAEYNTETKLLVLTGENSKVTSGNNFISGEKITLDRATGKATVEGSKKRVEALIYSGEIGIE